MHESAPSPECHAASPSAEDAFWRTYLAGLTTATRLGMAQGSIGVSPGRGTVSFSVDERDAASGVPLATLAYAAWARLLATYSGENDVVFGIAGGRPLRARVMPWQRVGDFLDTMAASVADVIVRSPTSPERLCELADFPPGSPLFDTAVYLDAVDENATNGWQLSVFIVVTATPVGTELVLNYARASLEDTEAFELIEQLAMLMRALSGCVDATLHAAPTLAGRYAARALHEWNATSEPYDERVTLHGLVERQAAMHPQRLAVVADDGELSYGELDRRANQLAHHLAELGVGPGTRVGLCTEKSAATVVGMLGIMKTGAAYVPIDPSYPASRIDYMAGDARLHALLTWGKGNAATASLQLPRVALDADWATVSQQPGDPLAFEVPSDAFAYAIYTSGSTGQPKCVLLNHRGRINNIEDYCRRLSLGEDDRVLCVSSLSFDISVCNIFCMFRAGGCIVFPSLDRLQDPDHWLDLMQRWTVTFWHSAPALLEALLEATTGRDYDQHGLRVALLGGDWIPLSQPDRARAAFPRLSFVTAGGATELSIDSTFYPVNAVDPDWRSIPYGRPLANQSALILSANLELLPPGVPGELHLGGVGMGAGYMNRPGLTAEKFIPHPWPSVPGERLYRTGDLARYMRDGTIELLGRIDFQVKIRGVRIELGELESILVEHPSVACCLAGAPRDAAGDRRLVAYVVPVAGNDGELAPSLHAWLAERLPSHLVPEAFMMLERLPLTPNGKVDRRNLPSPGADTYAGRAYEPPRGDVEQILARLWQSLLGPSRIGRHDSFLERGGHSLLSVRLRIQIRRSFGIDLALGDIVSSPSLAAMAERITHSHATPAEAVPAPRPPGQPAPLSFAQRRMWFISQMGQLGAAYHMPAAWHLRGALDEPALVMALNGVLDRHESLRSRFANEDGEPRLVIDPAGASMPLARHDLRGRTDVFEALEAILTEEAHAPFDLAGAPLVRARLIRVGEQDSVLALTQHHIVSDGWSYAPLLRDIGELYAAGTAGRAPALPPLPLQYADYAAWQSAWLSGEREQQLADYWRGTLANAPPMLALPTDRPHPMRPSPIGGTLPITIDAGTTSQLWQVARRHGSTLFGVVLAAWSVVLSRLSGQHDLVIGSVTAHRGHAETEALVGFFVNALALRIDLSGDPTLGELLARVRRTVIEAQDHEDLPFERVVELSQVERLPGRTPLFQTMLAWQSHDEGELRLDGLDVVRRDVSLDACRFELELSLRESGGTICGEFSYAASIFDATTIERHRGYLLRALQAIAGGGTQSVSEIELLDDDERNYLLSTLNSTKAPYETTLGVHESVSLIARQRGDALAVTQEQSSLSYAELDAAAERMASRLMALGAGEGELVAVVMSRSPAMIIALLAVLKSGAAYLPLDPRLPVERLAGILGEARPLALLHDEAVQGHSLHALLPSLPALIDAGRPCEASEPPAPACAGQRAVPDRLAYVIYTSGSSGAPKGVMVEHRALQNLVGWHGRRFGLTQGSRVAALAGLGFDASAWEIWATLCNGGTLLLPPAACRDDVVATLAWWSRQTVDTCFLVSPLAATAVADGTLPTSLRQLLIGGDRWLAPGVARPDGLALINNYGPTETTVVATSGELNGDDVHIGRPIANTRIYLLDARGRPVPFMATGELYVGGEGVARGYLRKAELTAERFLADPFDPRPGARMYRTGDLARYRADGNLVFEGRVDDQVKIRGYRIEPGEVQAVLASHPSLRQAFVDVRDEIKGEPHLVAYVEWHAQAADVSIDLLRSYLAERLPEYMLPRAFVALDSLPLTANGKVDRRALPIPDARAYLNQAYEAPEGETEARLASIWSELLNVFPVGRQDHFFELGGHSLIAMRLCSRVAQHFQVTLSVPALFAAPTLQRLAATIDASRRMAASTAPPIIPLAHPGPSPLSFGQQRLWFLAQFERINSTYNISLAFRIRGKLEINALSGAIDAMVARQASLRTVFVARDGLPEAHLLSQFAWPSLQVEHGQVHAAEPARLVLAEAARPFDLAAGPLLRARLEVFAEDDHLLMLTLHHIVADEWSLGVMAREIGAFYRACRDGSESGLTALEVQYPDFVAWQRRWLTAAELDRQATYWRERLAGAPPLLTLPLDRPRPAEQSYAGDAVPVTFDAALAADIRKLGRTHGVSPFMAVLAAWSIVLSRLSGQDDLIVGVPSAHRHQPGLEPLIGFFLNTLAVRVDLGEQPCVAGLLERVARAALDAQANQDLPLEQVVEIANPPRRLDHAPLFQVILAWRAHDARPLVLDGLHVESLPTPTRTVNFDLELSLGEHDDGIVGELAFATSLFERATIERHVGYIETTLRAMVADADQVAGRIDLLSVDERHDLLEVRNNTLASGLHERRVHEAFERHAAQTPEAIALVAGDDRFSYGELNTRANRLAHHFIALGICPGERVALCAERSVTMVAAMIAIHKAGGAYVPLDPAYPKARLHGVLEDAEVALVVVDRAGREGLGSQALAALRIDLDDEASWMSQPAGNPDSARLGARNDDAAYVIYTSGTTGTPKGVVVEHRQVVNFLESMAQAPGFASHDRLLAVTSISFDIAGLEIHLPLSLGAAVVLASRRDVAEPARLRHLLLEHRITAMQATPAGWTALLDAPGEPLPRDLRVLCGGEALNFALARRLCERFDEVWNLYGPTETTIWSTLSRVRASALFNVTHLSIGRPIAKTRIYLLDAYGQPVPTGAVGELHIGGDGVARGYHNRPALTAARFLADPFSLKAGARMYRTGDLARFLPDGELEFLGRNDHQVKLRGFRIELGEIEARLREHPAARDAVVMACDHGDDRRLVAYVLRAGEVALDGATATLRRHLAQTLPAYMLPAAFVMLDAWPLTPNGKLDRAALPPPGENTTERRAYAAPQGETEAMLAELWCELLKAEQVGRDDDFFELGGHSLLALQLLGRIEAEVGLRLEPTVLFRFPVLAQFAREMLLALVSLEFDPDQLSQLTLSGENTP